MSHLSSVFLVTAHYDLAQRSKIPQKTHYKYYIGRTLLKLKTSCLKLHNYQSYLTMKCCRILSMSAIVWVLDMLIKDLF